jgi:cyclopropane-fatty-acyl-phospholipid synthase
MLNAIRKYLAVDADDARAMLERVFRDHPTRNFAVRLWDGQELTWTDTRAFTLTFLDAETFRLCLASADPARFAEAYVDGHLLIEGDLWEASGLGSYIRKLELGVRDKLKFAPKLVVPASSHTVEHDRRDVQAHYDLSDDFFRLFLDEKMVYSCAYFATPEQDLERAQERKLDLICRKLALHPGETLLDVGCGWGALLIWAAQRYGVCAHGITLSENQAAEARHRVEAAGLGDRVTIELCHYADLPAERYDKISSVGMYEHVGTAKLPDYLGAVHRALRPGGLFLNHGITAPPGGPEHTGGAFIFRHVFPGAELAPVAHIQTELEDIGFEIVDVQGLREHYALTLRAWFERFITRRAEAARMVSGDVLRVWDLYLAGCARAFEEGVIGVHQVLAARPDEHGRTRAPLTREQMLQPLDIQS